ncbi:unnamed protein product, partial [Polarella glacialis]
TPDEVAALERENALLGAALDELLAREAEAESALASKSSKGLEEPPADEAREIRAALKSSEEECDRLRKTSEALASRLESVEAQRWTLLDQVREWRERCAEEEMFAPHEAFPARLVDHPVFDAELSQRLQESGQQLQKAQLRQGGSHCTKARTFRHRLGTQNSHSIQQQEPQPQQQQSQQRIISTTTTATVTAMIIIIATTAAATTITLITKAPIRTAIATLTPTPTPTTTTSHNRSGASNVATSSFSART